MVNGEWLNLQMKTPSFKNHHFRGGWFNDGEWLVKNHHGERLV